MIDKTNEHLKNWELTPFCAFTGDGPSDPEEKVKFIEEIQIHFPKFAKDCWNESNKFASIAMIQTYSQINNLYGLDIMLTKDGITMPSKDVLYEAIKFAKNV